jgi:hypothetical protein
MLANRYSPDDDVCPVGDELFSQLYGASKLGLPVLVATVAPDIRAMLALFCYQRSHLHEIGVTIAASCDEDDLVRSAGKLGTALFALSREPSPTVASHPSDRRKITLATGPLRKMAPIDDEPDDAISGPAAAVC